MIRQNVTNTYKTPSYMKGNGGKQGAHPPRVRPEAGKLSAACKRNECKRCVMLSCDHKCHESV